MIKFLAPFITEPPVWVWAILAGLLFIGWRASKEREVSAIRYAILPFLGLISIVTVAQSAPTAMTWAVFAAAYVIGAVFGWRAQGGIILGVDGARARLRGEWMTMGLVMTIFWLRFVRAAVDAVSPDIAAQPAVVIGFTWIAGVTAGAFLGRSARTVRAVYPAQTRAS